MWLNSHRYNTCFNKVTNQYSFSFEGEIGEYISENKEGLKFGWYYGGE